MGPLCRTQGASEVGRAEQHDRRNFEAVTLPELRQMDKKLFWIGATLNALSIALALVQIALMI